MLSTFFKRKEKKKYTYHKNYEDELFFEGAKLIEDKQLDEKALIALGSLMGVVLFKGDMKKMDDFLSKRTKEYKSAKK